MNEKREVDASHYPNFAALARDGTLFRNITTSSDTTVRAVPAILTGRYPFSFSLPIAADHPDNICTLLATTHRLETAETVTDLCGGERARPQDSKGRLRTILSDVSVVYLQLLLPEVSARRLLIFQTWDDPEREFTRFIERVRPAESPGFYFIHALVPHAPYWRLPSGKFYVESPLEPSGQGDQWGSWDADEWPVIQSFQRHLLQVGFADNLLGKLLTRLREVGLYDESLIVVTSDHGVSFRPGDFRRGLSATNLADILSVPVLIKTPFQRQGEISDVLGSTVDIVPTIADILSIRLPWATDGRSLLDNGLLDDRAIYFDGAELVAVDRPALEAKYDTLRQKLEWFPTRDGKERRFNVGPGAELIGETIESLEVQNAAGAYVELFESHHFKDVDPDSHFIPAQIVGKLNFADGVQDSTARLAIAINGVICATTQTYGPTGGRWSAVADPRCFQPGENRVEVFIINSLEDRFTLTRPLTLAIKSN